MAVSKETFTAGRSSLVTNLYDGLNIKGKLKGMKEKMSLNW